MAITLPKDSQGFAYVGDIENGGILLPVKSMQKKFRDSFGGPALDTSKWTVVQTGAGQTITVAGGMLQIATGTTPNSETIIEGKDQFSVPCRAMFGYYQTQKIANQEVIMELVSVDPTTLATDALHAAAWSINGNDNTTVTNGVYEVCNSGLARLRSASSSILTVAALSCMELEMFADETWFHQRAIDSASARTYSYVRHQQIPDPNGLYRLRIRVRNLSVAPASTTTVNFQFVAVQDYAELTTEITASRGAASGGMAMPVNVIGTVPTTTSVTSAYGLWFNDTSTNLGAGLAYTGTTRDHGTSVLASSRFRVVVAHTAGLVPGHLVYEMSTDSTTWRETHRVPVPSDGLYRTFEFPIIMRYSRVRFINGSTAQTQFLLNTAMLKWDGNFDLDKTIYFTHSTTALAGAATFTGSTLDLGANHSFNRHRATVFADQAGTLYLEESRDGSVWRTISTQPVTASTFLSAEALITQRYVRVRYLNGATLQGAFELNSALVRQ